MRRCEVLRHGPSARTRRQCSGSGAFIGAPGVSRATREDQHLFVNRRPVENRGLNFALLEGYHTALMKGRYPVCCLFLEIDPASVDVNIHPAKREVKFHRKPEVRRLVAQAVRLALLDFHKSTGQASHRASGLSTHSTSPIEKSEAEGSAFPPTGQAPGSSLDSPALPIRAPASNPTSSEVPAHSSALPGFPNALVPELPHAPVRSAETPPLRLGFGSTSPHSRGPGWQTTIPDTDRPPGSVPSSESGIRAATDPVPLLKVPLRLIGVIGKLYVVLESDRGLVLLDQHAAHERILFEQMLNRLEQSGQAPSQKLLLPETVEVSVRDANFLRGQLSALTRLGVGLSEFGEHTFLLDALPPFVKSPDPRRFVLELVDGLKAAGQEINSLRLGEHTVAKTVCRHAVKANDPLESAPAHSISHLAGFVLAITGVIFVVVGSLLVYAVIRFRRRADDDGMEPAQIYGSGPVEAAWTIVPFLIVVVLALTTARVIHEIQDARQPAGALEVQVIGHQWWWEFRYPKLGIVTANELHVPVSQGESGRLSLICAPRMSCIASGCHVWRARRTSSPTK
jgi:DNA mismatch repair ATPase MutL